MLEQAKEEPGTLLYALHRYKEDPHVFWTTEAYAADAAFAAHSASEVHAAASPVRGRRHRVRDRPEQENARAFRRQLAPFIEHARKAGRGQRRRLARPGPGGERAGDIRAWASQQGIAVSGRGRIPASVVAQYEAAARGG
jgi:hypothetical protein